MSVPHRNAMIAVFAAGLILAASWFGWRELRAANGSSSQTASSIEQTKGTPGVLKGQVAPDFSVPTLEGDTFRLSDHQGKPRIVFIMAHA